MSNPIIVPYGFVSPLVEYPNSGVNPPVPHGTFAVLPEDYAIYRGQPRVPEACWINAEAMVSSTGDYYTDRQSILDINADSFVTFLPLDSEWDATAAVWTPDRDNSVGRYTITADPAAAPVLGSVDYLVGREFFSSPAMVLQDGQLLSSDFNSGYDDAASLTVAMALNVREITGDHLIDFGDVGWLQFTVSDLIGRFDGHNFKVTVPHGPNNYTPLYVVLTAAQPKLSVYVGSSVFKTLKGSSPYTGRTTNLSFDLAGAIDIFSLDIWADDSPSAAQIISSYSSVLGGQS